MTGIKYTTDNVKGITVLCIVITVAIFGVFLKFMIHYYANQLKNRKNYSVITIKHNGRKIQLLGFNDTGNTLSYGVDKLPVFVCDYESINPLLTENTTEFNSINCNTILQESTIQTFAPDFIFVDGKEVRAVVGISKTPISADYDILFNANYLTNIEMEINYA